MNIHQLQEEVSKLKHTIYELEGVEIANHELELKNSHLIGKLQESNHTMVRQMELIKKQRNELDRLLEKNNSNVTTANARICLMERQLMAYKKEDSKKIGRKTKRKRK